MKSVSEKKRNPNRLLQALICISLGIHVLLFMHISGIYRSHALSYIELTLQDISKPYTRSIPRPRMRTKTPEITDVKKLNIQKQYIPKMNIDPVDNNLPDTLMEDISTPDIPDRSELAIADWNPGVHVNFATTNDYFEMVRLKIESCKRYPDFAREKHMEGQTKVRFVITPDGQISSIEIIKATRHDTLNRAALCAVRDAAPFPRPPKSLFNGPLFIEITIMFELT